jgi:hypothetical protein
MPSHVFAALQRIAWDIDQDPKMQPHLPEDGSGLMGAVRDVMNRLRAAPIAERFVRSKKSECLNRMIFFGQASLQHAISQFMAHYQTERNHQGLENRLVEPGPISCHLTPCISASVSAECSTITTAQPPERRQSSS